MFQQGNLSFQPHVSVPRRNRVGAAPARFEPRFIVEIVPSRGLRLANLGYLGHQWELYAMWTWAPILLAQAFEERGVGPNAASAVAIGVVAIGGLSSLLAGALADRFGRTTIASIAMITSGASALAAAALIQAPLWALVVILFIWGFTVIADSAKFSAAVTELSPPRVLGDGADAPDISGIPAHAWIHSAGSDRGRRSGRMAGRVRIAGAGPDVRGGGHTAAATCTRGGAAGGRSALGGMHKARAHAPHVSGHRTLYREHDVGSTRWGSRQGPCPYRWGCDRS